MMTRFCTLCVLLLVSIGAMAQDAPSWRSEADRPSRPELPPEVETAELTFEIDRDALFGQPMGFAPDRPRSAPVSMPKPGMDLDSELGMASFDDDIPNERAESATAIVDEAADNDPAPSALLGSVPAQTSDMEAAAAPAEAQNEPREIEEQPAVAEAATVSESSLASMAIPAELKRMQAEVESPSPASQYRLKPIRTVNPVYPSQAVRRGIEGWVDLELVVGLDGRVASVRVLQAEPQNVFESAARRAISRWRFEPPADDGLTSPPSGSFRLTFVLEDD